MKGLSFRVRDMEAESELERCRPPEGTGNDVG
jgi:hypothetical protein